jgi:hypothetical protein
MKRFLLRVKTQAKVNLKGAILHSQGELNDLIGDLNLWKKYGRNLKYQG